MVGKIGACHICFAEYEIEKLWQVTIEKLDEVVHMCRACLFDVYAIKWIDVTEAEMMHGESH